MMRRSINNVKRLIETGGRLILDAGARIVAALGEAGARELLGILERPDADRAELFGGCIPATMARPAADRFADDVGERRLRLSDALRREVGT